MLIIKIPSREVYDEEREEFFTIKGQVLRLEHSLVSLAKWESKWGKPFLSKELKTRTETIDYIRCMTITQNVNPDIYRFITSGIINKVNKYIQNPMTATTFSKRDQRSSREVITAEIIYYWMIALDVPFECQKWHLNRLLTLINVCNIKNQPKRKLTKREILERNRMINAERRQNLRTKG